jgi:hypothetical protein
MFLDNKFIDEATEIRNSIGGSAGPDIRAETMELAAIVAALAAYCHRLDSKISVLEAKL